MSQKEQLWKQKVDLFRRRFSCREDVFAVKWYKEISKENEKGELELVKTSGFAPQCENFWKEKLCLIREQKGGCSPCSNKQWAKLTDEWIWKHISGQKELVLYLLQENGIRFGAIDFDMGNPLADAVLCRDYSVNALGLPCYIARSSKKGYHLYWFFSDFIPAHLFTSMIRRVFKDVGLHERALTIPDFRLPELFPKQTEFQDKKIGNGIKVPMIEPKMEQGFNCWVDTDGSPIPLDQQWKYFRDAEEISLERFNKMIETHEIEIIERPVTRNARANERHFEGKYVRDPNSPKELRGDFRKVVMGCPALKQFWEQNEQGDYIFDKEVDKTNKGAPHAARLPSMLLALQTKNGEQMLMERWPTDHTKNAIEHAHEHDYSPVTCRYLQETGICKTGTHPKHGDHCFKKQPPKIFLGGGIMTNPDNLPDDQWPEPSPIRLATMRDGLSCEEIIDHLKKLFAENDPKKLPTDWNEQIQNLLKQAETLPAHEKKKVGDYIEASHLMTKKDLKDAKQRARRDVKDEQVAEKKQFNPYFKWKNREYFQENGHYLMVTVTEKGEKNSEELTNFTVDIKKELVEYRAVDDKRTGAERSIVSRNFEGTINVGGQKLHFNFRGDEWQGGSDTFFKYLIKIGGGALRWDRRDYDHIRNCINAFSQQSVVIQNKTNDIGHILIKKQHYYLMPSVIVSADGIKHNDEFDISFSDELCKNLDFKVLDEEKFKDLATHILNDFFNCNSQIVTMTAFAHAMASAMISHMPLKKSPVLWVNGNLSGGKSFIGEAAQCFFGDFTTVMGVGGSGTSKIGVANIFRDAILYIDDYKQSIERDEGKDIIRFIQAAYDRSGRTALNRDGTPRENMARVRGNIMFSGEDVPDQEASALSRMIIIEIANSKDVNQERGSRVLERRKDYCGFTPYFLQFVYSIPEKQIQAVYAEYRKLIEEPIKGRYDGAQRIAENLACNLTAFRLAMDMLASRGVISAEQRDMYCAQHIKNMEIVRTNICNYVSSKKGSSVFLTTVRELLQNPAKYHIRGWPSFNEFDFKNSTRLGFWRESEPELVYLMPQETCKAANQQLRDNKSYIQSQSHIGRQLYSDGHIPEGQFDKSASGGSYTKQIVGPDGSKARFWVLKLEALGLTPPTPPGGKAQNTKDGKNDLNGKKEPSSISDEEQPPLPEMAAG